MACILTPFQLLNETMIVRAPAVIAAWYGGRCRARSVASSSWVSPWSIEKSGVVDVPHVVPPSPTQCFGVASTSVGDDSGAAPGSCWRPRR